MFYFLVNMRVNNGNLTLDAVSWCFQTARIWVVNTHIHEF